VRKSGITGNDHGFLLRERGEKERSKQRKGKRGSFQDERRGRFMERVVTRKKISDRKKETIFP